MFVIRLRAFFFPPFFFRPIYERNSSSRRPQPEDRQGESCRRPKNTCKESRRSPPLLLTQQGSRARSRSSCNLRGSASDIDGRINGSPCVSKLLFLLFFTPQTALESRGPFVAATPSSAAGRSRHVCGWRSEGVCGSELSNSPFPLLLHALQTAYTNHALRVLPCNKLLFV